MTAHRSPDPDALRQRAETLAAYVASEGLVPITCALRAYGSGTLRGAIRFGLISIDRTTAHLCLSSAHPAIESVTQPAIHSTPQEATA